VEEFVDEGKDDEMTTDMTVQRR